MSEQSPLYFVHPHVITRLETGAFVAKRQQNKAYQLKDRRNMLSPLNVTRRAIRYEPLVFLNRKEAILEAVSALNHPDVRLMMTTGPSGRGKTAFVRGLLEMMGSGSEQVLWFDVSRHTDYDEVVRFLIEYMTLVCRAAESGPALPDTKNPIVTLERLLRQVKDCPILIVIDNIEYLVAPDKTLRSRELKEAFHFLLGFANVKMLFIGKTQPTADMNPESAAVYECQLAPLAPEWIEPTVLELAPQAPVAAFQTVLEALGGEPGALALFAALLPQSPSPSDWQARLTDTPNITRVLLDVLESHLTSEERLALQVFAMVRHGATHKALEAILTTCEPMLAGRHLLSKEHVQMHLALKKVYPPQLVLQHLQHRHQHTAPEGEAIRAYYQVGEALQGALMQEIPEETQARYHEALQGFYVAEKAKHVLDRLYPARTRHLAAEAQYHGSRVRRRRMAHIAQGLPNHVSYTETMQPLRREFPTGLGGDIPWPTFQANEEPALAPMAKEDLAPRLVPRAPQSAMAEVSVTSEGFRLGAETPSQTVHLSPDDLLRLAELIGMGVSPTEQIEAALPASIQPTQPTLYAAPQTESPFQPEPVADEELVLRNALEKAILSHSRPEIVQSLMALGQHRLQKGRFSNAEACLQKALDYATELGETPMVVSLHLALGEACLEHFRHNQALSHFKEVLWRKENQETTEAHTAMAKALLGLSHIYAYRQDHGQSLALIQKSLGLNKLPTPLKAQCHFEAAQRLDDSGLLNDAMAAYQKASLLYDEAGLLNGSAQSLVNLGVLYMETEQMPAAIDALKQSIRQHHQAHIPDEELRATLLLSRAYQDTGDLQQAISTAQSAQRLAQSMAQPVQLASVLLRLGQLEAETGDTHAASTYYQLALDAGGEDLSNQSRRRIETLLNQHKETPQ